MKVGDDLLKLSRPHFGQAVTWLLLAFALTLTALPFEPQTGPRNEQAATLLSLLPGAWLASPLVFNATRVVLAVAAVLWAARRLVPWTCWLTVAAFTALWSLRMENVSSGAHIFNLTNMLLLIHALWYQFYHRDIAAAVRAGTFWQTPLYPRWAYLLGVFYIGWFHTLAGLSKIATSGLGWGNGLSLQLWVYLWGWEYSPFGNVILANRTLAMLFQSTALFFETVSILAIVPRLRVWIGLGLLGFYVGVLGTFVDYGFHFNAILVALFFLPVERWMGSEINFGRADD